jgi:hypothetical protein
MKIKSCIVEIEDGQITLGSDVYVEKTNEKAKIIGFNLLQSAEDPTSVYGKVYIEIDGGVEEISVDNLYVK